MRFIEDTIRGLPMDTKIGITNLLDNITTKPGSHKGGWTRILKCQLNRLQFKNVKILGSKDKLEDFSIIIFDLGAEFKGTLNMFGGLNEKVFDRLAELNSFKGQLFSWLHELPDLKVLESRRSNESTCQKFKESSIDFIDQIMSNLSRTIVFDHTYRTDALLIGDSHTASVWNPRYMIERRDGRTLRGMVENQTISKYYNKFKENDIDLTRIAVHAGSIDIRHHIMREQEPAEELAILLSTLNNQLLELNLENYVLVETMGIEDESRKLPKTGYFKGTPFYGSWSARNEMRKFFNFALSEFERRNEKCVVLKFPTYFFDQSDKLKFDVMEKPGSVHLSPEFYWTDLDSGKARW